MRRELTSGNEFVLLSNTGCFCPACKSFGIDADLLRCSLEPCFYLEEKSLNKFLFSTNKETLLGIKPAI